MTLPRRVTQWTLGVLLWSVFGTGGAQTSDAVVRPLIPDRVLLQSASDAGFSFDITAANYPPARFPHRYFSGVQVFGVFSNVAGAWSVQMQTNDILDARSARLIPTGQLFFRVNEGAWLQADGTPQVIYNSIGPTGGWQTLRVEFALELRGDEIGGQYGAHVSFSAIALP